MEFIPNSDVYGFVGSLTADTRNTSRALVDQITTLSHDIRDEFEELALHFGL